MKLFFLRIILKNEKVILNNKYISVVAKYLRIWKKCEWRLWIHIML